MAGKKKMKLPKWSDERRARWMSKRWPTKPVAEEKTPLEDVKEMMVEKPEVNG